MGHLTGRDQLLPKWSWAMRRGRMERALDASGGSSGGRLALRRFGVPQSVLSAVPMSKITRLSLSITRRYFECR